MGITVGFGTTFDLQRGTSRAWVVGIDGVKRWADNGDACEGCRRCGGAMLPGAAMTSTYTGAPDFPGGECGTLSPGGPGRMVECMKCASCGHSVLPNARIEPGRCE